MGDLSMIRQPLTLGRFEHSSQEYLYDGNESLLTIARPGRGKTQAFVIRNLLRLNAPAVVLDVKPELFAATAGWRSRAVGPVVRFQPSDLRGSARFNPLDSIPRNSITASKAIGELVRLLVIPDSPKGTEGFWEGRAMQFVQAALLDVALFAPDSRRNMATVVEWLSPSLERLSQTIERLKGCGVPSLVRMGNELERMPDNTREGLFSSAQRHVEVWGAPEVVPLTSTTTWSFDALRQRKGTLYLCVTREEIEAYAPVIRVILGQALREYRTGTGGQQVTFFVDEFPQLGYMEGLIRLLELGRGAGCRVWILAQSFGQILEKYGEHIANAIMEMCHVRSFIEPTGDLAERLERELGGTKNIYTGQSRPLATARELSGPAFVGKVIVLEGGHDPAMLKRIYAYQDPALAGRLNLPVS